MRLARRHRSARAVLATVLVAVLFAQWVALAHAVLHAPSMPARSAASAGPPSHPDAFGHAAHAAECRLFDHLLTGQAAMPPCDLSVPALPRDETAAVLFAAVSTALVLAYAARAPPRA